MVFKCLLFDFVLLSAQGNHTGERLFLGPADADAQQGNAWSLLTDKTAVTLYFNKVFYEVMLQLSVYSFHYWYSA